MVSHRSSDHAVVFDHCDPTRAREVRCFTHSLTVVLLRLNNVTSQHLGILYLDLWIVENIIIVVYILYNFNGLVSFLFLWL